MSRSPAKGAQRVPAEKACPDQPRRNQQLDPLSRSRPARRQGPWLTPIPPSHWRSSPERWSPSVGRGSVGEQLAVAIFCPGLILGGVISAVMAWILGGLFSAISMQVAVVLVAVAVIGACFETGMWSS
jgi:hypothetical protein